MHATDFVHAVKMWWGRSHQPRAPTKFGRTERRTSGSLCRTARVPLISIWESQPMKQSAEISSCRLYRYELRRVWDESKPLVLFIGLNPSTADADKDDNTSRVCVNYAMRWGFGGLLLGNLFAYRSTDQSALYSAEDAVGPDNDAWLHRLQSQAGLVICAWSDTGALQGRDQAVLSFLKAPHCLVKLKSGRPGHPLYKRADLQPVPL